MVKYFNFIVGDWSGDGHGKYETYLIKAEFESGKENIVERLQENEAKLKELYDINLSTWLNNYEENVISAEELGKLNKLNIKYERYDDEEEGTLTVECPDTFLHIWFQLMELVDKDLKLSVVNLDIFISNCTGYGIFTE
jgi:hypothetical protein